MLKPRLQEIYDLISKTKHVVDVGSDHAFLCVELLKNNICEYVTNIEINESPLQNGLNNVKKNNLQSRAKFILNNGFNNLKLSKKPDGICISGMGAENIIQVIINNIYNKPGWYILQANNDINKLRIFLYQNNYQIINEILVFDNNRYYEILKVIPNKVNNISKVDIHIGPLFKNNNSFEYKNYLKSRYNHLKQIPYNLTSEFIREEFDTIKKFLNDKKWIN